MLASLWHVTCQQDDTYLQAQAIHEGVHHDMPVFVTRSFCTSLGQHKQSSPIMPFAASICQRLEGLESPLHPALSRNKFFKTLTHHKLHLPIFPSLP